MSSIMRPASSIPTLLRNPRFPLFRPRNGGRHRADPAGCAQEGAVAADADSQLGRCGAESDNSGWQILGAESEGIAVLHSYGGTSESFPETGYKVESGPATRRVLTPFAVYGY